MVKTTVNYGKKWTPPTPEQIGEVVNSLGTVREVGILLRLSPNSVKKGSKKIRDWMNGNSPIPPCAWAVLQMSVEGVEVGEYFNV